VDLRAQTIITFEHLRRERLRASQFQRWCCMHWTIHSFASLPQTREALTTNPAIRLIETDHGGHCAFLPGLWGRGPTREALAEATLVRFLVAVAGAPHGS